MLPKWCTAERQNHMIDLFLRSAGFCVFGHRPCENPEHHYESFIEGLIWEWKRDDAQERVYLWELERRRIHRLPEFSKRGRFDVIAKDEFMRKRPEWYLVGLAVNPLNHKRLAVVRIPSSSVYLYVDVEPVQKNMSKNRRRKMFRHGASPPVEVMRRIEALCSLAVGDYWKN